MTRTHLIAGLLAISSCTGLHEDYGPRNVDDNPLPSASTGVIILNEGNFQFGNASIDIYDKANNSTSRNVFQSINKRPLGDVAQSMLMDADTGYIVVNNSGKIEKVLLPTMQSMGSLQGLSSPRYMIKIDDKKGYVSDLASGRITVFNPSTLVKTREIEVSGWTEKMFRYKNLVYVQSVDHSGMYIIDVQQDIYIGMISIPDLLDAAIINDRELIYLSEGALGILSMENNNLTPLLKLNGLTTFSRIDFDPLSQKVLIVSRDLLEYSLLSQELDTLFLSGERNFYGLKVDRTTGDIYLTDARDFIQNGEVLWLSNDGIIREIIEGGKIPQDIHFLYE